MAFYNEHRPRTFDQVLGQDQVTAILKKQAKLWAFHHSYLLFGPSGSGKTTTARILAACLNCYNLDGVGEPCGECQSCRAIFGCKSWDVIEIDGARFRGIEDMKDLCYRAYLCPIGNRKVYVIDEAHQITDAGFNAMLKLLEEPPGHLVLILCTTDYGKIPETVSSRCQLYPFKKLKDEDITRKVEMIAGIEGIELDPKHLAFIAQTAGGNMRSSENMMEQCVVGVKV